MWLGNLWAQALANAKGAGAALRDFLIDKPAGAISAIIIAFMVAVAVAAPAVAPDDPNRTELLSRLLPPSGAHAFGTDELGRDVLSRVIHGARLSLLVGITSTVVGTLVGALIGILSAFAGRRTDDWIQRGMDVLLSFPALILALAIVAMIGPSVINVIIAIAIPFVPRANRILRSAALAVRDYQYIEAARAGGLKPWRIVLRHMVPNCVAPYIVISTALLGNAITVEATLSFLGLGTPPPAPSWGRSLSDGMHFISQGPWLVIFPGIALSMTVMAVNLLGDALRDTLDPKRKIR